MRHWLRHFGADRFVLLEEEQLRSQPEWVASTLSTFLQLPKPLTAEAMLSTASNHSHAPVVGDALKRSLRSFYDEHVPQVRAIFEQLAPPGSKWADAPWLTPGRPGVLGAND